MPLNSTQRRSKAGTSKSSSRNEDMRYQMPTLEACCAVSPIEHCRRNKKILMDDIFVNELLKCPRGVERFTSGEFSLQDFDLEEQEMRERRHSKRRNAVRVWQRRRL